MSNIISKRIQQVATKGKTQDKFSTVKAVVIAYSHDTNLADIQYNSPAGGGQLRQENVPVSIPSMGVKNYPLECGNTVYVSFVNGSPLLPKIVGMADEQFESRGRLSTDHKLSGGLYVPSYKEPLGHHKRAIDRYIDIENANISKYSRYISHSLDSYMEEVQIDLGNYEEKSIGLTNPFNSSTVKISDNGEVFINVNGDIGLRVNPKSKSIKLDAIGGTIHNKSSEWVIETDNFKLSSNEIDINAKNININGRSVFEGEGFTDNK